MRRVLSVDGGGLRGAIALYAIDDIERRVEKPIEQCFDLIAGTSTGALIAIGLCYSKNGIDRAYSTSELINIYETRGGEIFPKPLLQPARFCRSLFHRKYSNHGLRKVLSDLFGDDRLNSCLKPVLIPAYDLRTNQPIVFTSRQVRAESNDAYNPKIIDVLLATTAAPTYLPSHKFRLTALASEKRFVQAIDGGIFANNPTLLALREVMAHESGSFYGGPVDRSSVFALSLGTGEHCQDYAVRWTRHWGVIPWGLRLFDVISQSSSATTEDLVRELVLPTTNYLRVNLDIEDVKHSKIDSFSPASFTHWRELYNEQVMGDIVSSGRIDQFLGASGISDADLTEL